jgi:hypothetical protein
MLTANFVKYFTHFDERVGAHVRVCVCECSRDYDNDYDDNSITHGSNRITIIGNIIIHWQHFPRSETFRRVVRVRPPQHARTI